MTSASAAIKPGAGAGTASSRLADVASRRPLFTALVVVFILTALHLADTVDSDVATQLWIAHQINGGARLYRDIIEVNPPLWFWLALPVDRIATLLNVRAEHVLAPFIGCAV